MSFLHNAVFLNSAIFVGLAIAASLVGHWLAKVLQAEDYGWTYAIVLFTILAGMVVVVRCWPPKPGIDQVGGSILVYKVDAQKTDWRPEKMDFLVTAISRRVNSGGWKNISVRSAGDDLVEIVIPNVRGRTAQDKQAEADAIRKIICTTGALEFRIVATKRDNESLIEVAQMERKKFPVDTPRTIAVIEPVTRRELAKWCRVRDQEVDKIKGDEAALLVGKDKQGKEVWEVLVLAPESDVYNVTGADIREARAGIDPETAAPDVLFSFNAAGGAKFGHLTGEHVPIGDFRYKLAIVLDDVVQTAPTILSQITDNGRITGDFTQREVDEIVAIINAGALPAALEPTPVRETIVEAAAPSGAARWGSSILPCVLPMIAVFAVLLCFVVCWPRKREQAG
jgi:SecD/SecF fusion protein